MNIPAVTVQQIQDLDKMAIEKYGVPSLALMENAGWAVAHFVMKELKKKNAHRVCIVCGMGNNAGDGFVAARHLLNAGVKTQIYLVGRSYKLKDDALVNFQILNKVGVGIKPIYGSPRAFEKSLAWADIVVDAVFGVGLNRDIEEPFRSVIAAINKKAKKVVAVDIPSGLDGTTGKIYGVCVKAHATVTFSFAKKGFFKAQGPKYTGKVAVVDIGIPIPLKKRI